MKTTEWDKDVEKSMERAVVMNTDKSRESTGEGK